MTPRSDICPKCENHRANISTAAGQQEKQEHLQAFTEHLLMVEKERQVYNNAVKNARKEMELNHRPAGVIPPCSTDLKEVHYTFDFSQALSIPHHARQEGPLYFLTPRKVQLFGVAIEGQHHQINYLIDEDQGIGENGAGIKGANGVVSMLHHCLTTYGSGERSCVIHCDICAGKLFVKSHADDSEREITLLKSSISPEEITTGSVMPDILPPGGMTSERQRYLFRVVRPFVRDPFKDTTCPEAEE
nr:uncharacterized protein LOC117686543 [Crassostrea gigas]